MTHTKSLATVLTAAIVASCAVVVSAQQPVAAPARSGVGGTVPDGKIAVIYVASFPDKVAELQRTIEALNKRYEPRSKELQALGDQISGIEAQVQQGTVTPAQAGQLEERYQQLKRDFTRKREDLTAEAQKAYAAATEPIQNKLRAALDKYAAERGVVLVIEVGGALNVGSIFYAAEGTNITDDFIAGFNKANP